MSRESDPIDPLTDVHIGVLSQGSSNQLKATRPAPPSNLPIRHRDQQLSLVADDVLGTCLCRDG
jgi:hypothetical protein